MINTDEYRNAPSGMGPHAYDWKDKPHRLIYDLCAEVDRLQQVQLTVVRENALEEAALLCEKMAVGAPAAAESKEEQQIAAHVEFAASILAGAIRALKQKK